MTEPDFFELMECNEPDLEYNGEIYTICNPCTGVYGVASSDNPNDIDLVFHSLDDLLDNWIVQGKRFRDILPEIEY